MDVTITLPEQGKPAKVEYGQKNFLILNRPESYESQEEYEENMKRIAETHIGKAVAWFSLQTYDGKITGTIEIEGE